MRTVLSKTLLVLTLASSSAFAQNSDLGIMAGGVFQAAEVVSGPQSRVSTRNGATGQINYAMQLRNTRAGDLYFEVPLFITHHDVTSIGPGFVSASSGGQVILTPGVRLKIPLNARVSLIGAAGFGIGSFLPIVEGRINAGPAVASGRHTGAVFGFGGGLDFRLTRLLSLRFDLRDFVSTAEIDGTSAHNRLIATGGMAFHF